MPAADSLLAHLVQHSTVSLTEVISALMKEHTLEESVRSITALTQAGFVAYDCRVTLSLTPMGRALAQSVAENQR